MKNAIIIMLLFSLFAACTGREAAGFNGIYVRQFDQEYARGSDTVIISMAVDKANNFDIVKRSAFHRIADGHVQERMEKKIQQMTAVLDNGQQLLYETRHGTVLSLGSNKQELHWGTAIYKRIQ